LHHTKSILLCGATGLVGRHCLRLLSHSPAFGRIVVLTRRPLPPEVLRDVNPEKVEEHVLPFDEMEAHPQLFRVDQIVCALGTTIKKAGSKDRFRQVDFQYPLSMARIGIHEGATHFLLVSAVGANARSRFFYSRVKGEVEDALLALPYRSTTVVRPSLLLGERDDFRLGEEIAKRLGFLAPARYKPVAAEAVAAELVRAAEEDLPGTRIIESHRIRARAHGSPSGHGGS
jgi:uncharacterized protein YbjT (DUF2867 family)